MRASTVASGLAAAFGRMRIVPAARSVAPFRHELERRRQRWNERFALLERGDRTLSDIGICRSQAAFEAFRMWLDLRGPDEPLTASCRSAPQRCAIGNSVSLGASDGRRNPNRASSRRHANDPRSDCDSVIRGCRAVTPLTAVACGSAGYRRGPP